MIRESELREGLIVVYIPSYLDKPYESDEVEVGYVSSWNDSYVFVKYDGHNSQATRREDLMTEGDYEAVRFLVEGD